MMDKVGNKAAKQEIAMIKVIAPEMACNVVDRAIQVHGALGVCQDTFLASAWANLRTLRLADGTRLFLRKAPSVGRSAATLIVEGDAWAEGLGGDVRLRLPERVEVFRGSAGEDLEGMKVVVLSRFRDLAPASLRQSSTPWPSDALLVLGGMDEAAAGLVGRARSIASSLGVPALALLVAATVIPVLEL